MSSMDLVLSEKYKAFLKCRADRAELYKLRYASCTEIQCQEETV